MHFLLKNFISFFLISLLSTIIFIWYLIYQGFPGGAVGMAPFGIILNSIFTIIISLIFIQLIKIVLNAELSLSKNNWIFTLIYILSSSFFFGSNPFDQYKDEMFKNVVLWTYICEIISLFLVNGILFIKYKINNKFWLNHE